MMDIFVETFDYHDDPSAIFASIAAQPYALFFDSADRAHPDARYSYIMHDPIAILEDSKLLDPFSSLQQFLKRYDFCTQNRSDLPPFQGGIAGLLSYDLARSLEDMPSIASHDIMPPDIAFGVYDQLIAFDHHLKKAWIITHADNAQRAKAKQEKLIGHLTITPESKAYRLDSPLDWDADLSKDVFCDKINAVKQHIKKGDIFQANLTQRFSTKLPDQFDKFSHYRYLRRLNPSPFAAYFNIGGFQISSASPERFLQVTHAGFCTTKPIKGTRPRLSDRDADLAQQNDLLSCAKDRAENIMITDLLRNDLSKTCIDDTIQTPSICALESFSTVHHLVSTVTGELLPDKNALDLMQHCFPGGSITGAPKIQAMHVIEMLEPVRRGAYCGSLVMVGFNGYMDSNILIRTLIHTADTASFHVGSGITALSSAEDEYQETLDKAKALFKSFLSPSNTETI